MRAMLVQFTDGSQWWAATGVVHDDGEKCDYCREHLRAKQSVVVMDQVRRGFLDLAWKGTRVAHVRCADADIVAAAATALGLAVA